MQIAVCPACQRGLTDADKAKGYISLPAFHKSKGHMWKLSYLQRTAASGCPLCAILLRCIMRTADVQTPAEELNLVLIRIRRMMSLKYDIMNAGLGSKASYYAPTPELQIVPIKGRNLTYIRSTDCSLLLIDLEGCVDAFPDPGSRTDSQGCQRLVKTWVDQCITLHELCGPSLNSTSHIPGRLLDLSPGNKSGGYFAVVEGVSREEDCRYACLSHCWGGEQPLKLTKDTAGELANGLPVEDLPPTFRDAVTVCGWLDIRYLWIDSLCILQDSKDDWSTQSFQMRSIFKNAYLTIAATYGSTCQCGLFNGRNPVTSVIPFGQVTLLGLGGRRSNTIRDSRRHPTLGDSG